MRKTISICLPVVGACLLAGCPDRTISAVPPQQQGVTQKDIPVSADIDILFVIDNSRSTQDKQTVFNNNLATFVTGTGGSGGLGNFPGVGLPNLHIGVVDTTVDIGVQGYGPSCPSPDPGDNGLLQNTAQVTGCTPPSGRYISDIKNPDGSRTTNYGGAGSATDLGAELQCIGEVGTSGCGFEAQLQAMKLALNGSNPENAGFIRDGAYLAIIFLTDEDDASVSDNSVFQGNLTSDFPVQPLYAYKCDQAISATAPGPTGGYTNCTVRTDSYLADPASYASFLSTVKDPSQIVVAVIAGPPPGLTTNDTPGITCSDSCGSNFLNTGPLMIPGTGQTQQLALLNSCDATINGNPAIARPGVRLADFLSNFGSDRGRFYSVCQSDYTAALTDIGNTLFNAVSPCLEGPIDTSNASTNSVGYTQLQCTVTDVQNQGTSSETQTLLQPCKMDNATTPDPGNTFPCWYDQLDTTKCPSPDTGWELNIDRNGVAPATGTVTDVQCAITTN